MSLREVVIRGAKRGVQLVKAVTRGNKNLKKQDISSGVKNDGITRILLGPTLRSPLARKSADLIGLFNHVWRHGVKETLASGLRRCAGWGFLCARPGGRYGVPLLGFVGLTMMSTSGPGLITDHDEFKAICEQIRVSISTLSTEVKDSKVTEMKSLADFTIGSVIAKGCNAAVYAAKAKSLGQMLHSREINEENVFRKSAKEVDNDNLRGRFADYPLALKIMFNYDAESNAPVIFRAMYRETLPTKCLMLANKPSGVWEAERFLKALPHHPNIVDMKCAFADRMPCLPEQQQLYPHALPARLYAEGCGRNMTLFLVMKRYHKSLNEYLELYKPSSRVSVILLSQLLEGVQHLNKNGIAHRDLKSDNILLDLSTGPELPHLVITDFGCCSVSMSVPFPSLHFDQREGNVAMMAPEISCAVPGPFVSIDYSKADLWAIGALTYEIFGMPNPFYRIKVNDEIIHRFDSRTYEENELPRMPDYIPFAIKGMVKNLLLRDPAKRMQVGVAANICHLLLMAPCQWLINVGKCPSEEDVTKWLVLQACSCASHHWRYTILNIMKLVFLHRVRIEEVTDALGFIRSCP